MASEKYEDCFVKRARGISGSSIGLISTHLFLSDQTCFPVHIGMDCKAYVSSPKYKAENPGVQDSHYSTPWLTLTLGSISKLRENK